MFKKIEFTAATGLFGWIIYEMLKTAGQITKLGKLSGMDQQFTNKGIPFTYPESYYHYFLYPDLANAIVIYLGFLFLNFFVVPQLYNRQKYMPALVYTLLALAVTWVTFSITSHIEFSVPYSMSIVRSAVTLWLLGIFFLYTVIKKIIRHYSKKQETLIHDIIQKFLIALVIWVAILAFILNTGRPDYRDLAPYWGTLVPSFLILLITNIYWLMPAYENRQQQKETYIIKLLFISFFVFAPFGFILFVATHINLLIVLGLWVVEVALAVPLAWYLYQQNKKRIAQLLNLKKDLSSTLADLNLLRSQINPHFLFNALNTLYATALQENSERTAEGIQKLGDMMRFMLHENNQEKIPLNREIEYLGNYIDLQKLRTQSSPDILIELSIDEDPATNLLIAPMLLIPFIENAFKHGISLMEPSHIKITLHFQDGHLLFDVVNSLHPKTDNDPEKDKNGIGLENVKQRLQLLYPGNHQLAIREDTTDFFIHLNINLV